MGHPQRYVFSSCLRLAGGRLGLNLHISNSLRAIHFWPDQKPVIGPQHLARNTQLAIYNSAQLNRDPALHPITQPLRRDRKQIGRDLEAYFIYRLFECLHVSIFTRCEYMCQQVVKQRTHILFKLNL